MRTRSPALPTTEEPDHRSEDGGPHGHRVLLCAFPPSAEIGAIDLPAGQTVGRAWLLDHGIDDKSVSREHVSFSWQGSRIRIEDVGSKWGTFVGGSRLTRGELIEDGAVIRIGRTVLVYRSSFTGSRAADQPLGQLVGPWGLRDVRRSLERLLPVAPGMKRNVLIEGETGTGKEALAAEVAARLRPGRPYAPINVAAFPADRFEAELFGWEHGAFTSARANPGLIRTHEGGVVFFDEIQALPPPVQPKLLRFVETRDFVPLGAGRPVRSDVVVIAATNQSVEEMIGKGELRRDLAARFAPTLRLPPLRERPEDMFAILEACWRAERPGEALDPASIASEAVGILMRGAWPENVRGLKRLVWAIDPAQGLTEALAREIAGEPRRGSPTLTTEAAIAAVAVTGGNISRAAEMLGVDRKKVERKLKHE